MKEQQSGNVIAESEISQGYFKKVAIWGISGLTGGLFLGSALGAAIMPALATGICMATGIGYLQSEENSRSPEGKEVLAQIANKPINVYLNNIAKGMGVGSALGMMALGGLPAIGTTMFAGGIIGLVANVEPKIENLINSPYELVKSKIKSSTKGKVENATSDLEIKPPLEQTNLKDLQQNEKNAQWQNQVLERRKETDKTR